MNSKVRVSDYMSKNVQIQKKIESRFCKIVAYPQSYVKDIARVMMDIKIDSMPVIFSPWNKKQVGFIELKKISAFLNE